MTFRASVAETIRLGMDGCGLRKNTFSASSVMPGALATAANGGAPPFGLTVALGSTEWHCEQFWVA